MGGSLLLLLAALMVEGALLLPAMPRPADRGVGISKGLVEEALMTIYAAVKQVNISFESCWLVCWMILCCRVSLGFLGK